MLKVAFKFLSLVSLFFASHLYADSPALRSESGKAVRIRSGDICGTGFAQVKLGVRKPRSYVLLDANGEFVKNSDGQVIELLLRPREAKRLTNAEGAIQIRGQGVSLDGVELVRAGDASGRRVLQHQQHERYLEAAFSTARDTLLEEGPSVEAAMELSGNLAALLEWAYRYEAIKENDKSLLAELADIVFDTARDLAEKSDPNFSKVWRLYRELTAHARSVEERAQDGTWQEDYMLPFEAIGSQTTGPWAHRYSESIDPGN